MATLLCFLSVCRIHMFMGLFIQILFKFFQSVCFCAVQWGQSHEIALSLHSLRRTLGCDHPSDPLRTLASRHCPAESVLLRHTAL